MSNPAPFPTRFRPLFARAMAAACAAALAVTAAAAAVEPRFNDTGTYRVYQGSRFLGTETFSFEPYHDDSIFVFSRVVQGLPRGGDVVDSLDKKAAIVFRAADFDLRGYESNQVLNGARVKRELKMDDTSFTTVRENDLGGTAVVLVRPPGRVFVLDPQVFVLFDIIFRYLHESSFTDRPVPILFLGARDTVFDVRVKQLGPDPIRWGTRTVQARKVSLSDAGSLYYAWMSPEGRMLRLTLDAVGLRVEREPDPPPAPKRKPATPMKGKTPGG